MKNKIKTTFLNIKNNNFTKEIISIINILIISLIIIIPIKYFLIEPFIVEGTSMSPNYETGNYLIVNKLSGKITNLHRGEITIFTPPHERSSSWLKYTTYLDPRKKYIKRIIGLPGERVVLKDNKVFIQKKGMELIEIEEPYIKNNGTTRTVDVTLKSNEYFVLGDNRGDSFDSEEFGPILKSDILGTPLLRLFPTDKIGLLPANYTNYSIDK